MFNFQHGTLFEQINNESCGSGFLINPETVGYTRKEKKYTNSRYVLTNAHVVENSKTKHCKIIFPENKVFYMAKIVKISTELDFALLRICNKNMENNTEDILKSIDNLKLVCKYYTTKSNFEIYTIGFPNNCDEHRISVGFLSGIFEENYQLNLSLNPGNSGGPVFNSNGEVIAIAVAKEGEAISMAVPTFQIYNLITKWSKSNKCNIRPPSLSFNWSIQRDIMSKQYGGCGVLVNKDKNNMICPMDIIIKIGDYDIDNRGYVDFHNQKIKFDSNLILFSMYKYSIVQIRKSDGTKYQTIFKNLLNRDPFYCVPYFDDNGFNIVSLSGMVFTDIVNQHVEYAIHVQNDDIEIEDAIGLQNTINTKKNVVVLSYIYPQSLATLEYEDIDLTNAIVYSINNIPISNVQDMKDIVQNILKHSSKSIIIMNTSKHILCFGVEEAIREERRICNIENRFLNSSLLYVNGSSSKRKTII